MPELSEMTGVLSWLAGALLVLAGTAKLRAPAGTVRALSDAHLPGTPGLVRALGALELAVGTAVLAVGGRPPAIAAALLYAGFAGFVVRGRRTVGASCGCFGEERTPVGRVHVVVNVVAAASAGSAAGAGSPALWEAAAGAATTLGTLVLVAVGAWLVRLALTAGAELQAAVALHPREVSA